jgi:hypothetical protein
MQNKRKCRKNKINKSSGLLVYRALPKGFVLFGSFVIEYKKGEIEKFSYD